MPQCASQRAHASLHFKVCGCCCPCLPQQTGLRAALGRLLLGKSPAPVPPAPGGGSGSGGGASSSTAAGTVRAARRQPIEIVVDQGRPVTVRFSGGEEEDLSEELEIEVGSAEFWVLGARLLVGFGASMFSGDVEKVVGMADRAVRGAIETHLGGGQQAQHAASCTSSKHSLALVASCNRLVLDACPCLDLVLVD